MAAEINAKYSEHNISASVEIDDDGNDFVRMYQNQGYNIQIDDFVTAGTTGLDFNGDGVTEVTGSVNKRQLLRVVRSLLTRSIAS